jgi:hypothetical protein
VYLNKEWTKNPKRNIEQILNEYKKKKFIENRKLSKEMISVIAKNYAKILKRKKQAEKKLTNGQANGHHDENSQEDDNSEDDELVIEDDNEAKPEYLKYFENKCTEPSFEPEKLLWVKPDKETMNKFYENLMSQNRKRPHEAIQNGDSHGKTENSSTDTSPQSKRINNNSSQNQLKNSKPARMPQKSGKPIQSINLLNAPEEIYYVANKALKTIRKDIETVELRKLSRKPSRELSKEALYETVGKIRTEALANLVKPDGKKLNGDTDEKNKESADVEMTEDDNKKDSTGKEAKGPVVVLD